ncbi:MULTISPECIES: GNAT family N-acetyltransferase [Sphingobacterium]|uniref:GNAT family N-acetyltransferase n=1 Tax=Sphingobacterium TaxID=28453 RepID=UPI00257AF626|nr:MULTISPECIES: GNAT family N-acetyltransferase [Sphingobacterium]
MENSLQNVLNEIPIQLDTYINMEQPNETLPIYHGEFVITNGTEESLVNGSIEFTWFPNPCVKFNGTFSDGELMFFEMKNLILKINNENIGVVNLSEVSLGERGQCRGYVNRFIEGDSSIAVQEIMFCIPNLRGYIGDRVRHSENRQKISSNRIELIDRYFRIILDKFSDFTDRKKKLQNNGGYLLTYVGKVSKINGQPIRLKEIHEWHQQLQNFLFFINGLRASPLFYRGIHDGREIFTDYSFYNSDPYKFVHSWSNISENIDFNKLWKEYIRLWKNENNRDFLLTAVHWYVEANSNAGKVEGSIILIQTALELIYNWLIVENEKIIIGNEAEGVSAANKIRLLIFQLKISRCIPDSFEDLISVAKESDGPEIFVKIRNALVHGQETKRNELQKIPDRAKFQALQLGIWYVELALLYILKYKGRYNNRTDGKIWEGEGEIVPWANSKKFKIGPPSEFKETEIESFLDLLQTQAKVKNPSLDRIRNCKLIAIGYDWNTPISIGAIKPKTKSDFTENKANLLEEADKYEWEIGYFFTDPEFQGKGYSSQILKELLNKYGKGNLMATTEMRENNAMIYLLEKHGFLRKGNPWKSAISGKDLNLYLRNFENKTSKNQA